MKIEPQHERLPRKFPQRIRPGPRLWQLPYSLTFIWKYLFLSKRKIYKLNHQVSLCQSRLFTTECLFDPILSLSPLFSGLHSSLLLYKGNASKTSLAKMIVLFFLMGMVTEETSSRFHFQYIWGDKYNSLFTALFSSLSVQGVLVNSGKRSRATMTVLFFLLGMVTEETHQVPVQSLPFPICPGWQAQT